MAMVAQLSIDSYRFIKLLISSIQLMSEAAINSGHFFSFTFRWFHCCLYHPSSLPLSIAFIFHSPPNHTQSSVSVILFSVYPPLLIASALFINSSPSILSTCSAHFNQLLTSFLLKTSFTPTSSLSSSILPHKFCHSKFFLPKQQTPDNKLTRKPLHLLIVNPTI